MKSDYNKLYKRFCNAKNHKSHWLGLYADLYRYVLPNRDAFNQIFAYCDQGKPETVEIYDPTAMVAAYQRANDLHGLMLPQDRVWGKLALDPHLYNQEAIDSAQGVMDEINARIFFYLNQSNLSRAVSSSNLDLVGGTAGLWVESFSDEVPLYFRPIPSIALFLEYTTDDLINTCWYVQSMKARAILETFPDYNGEMLRALTEQPNTEHMVVYGQVREEDGEFHIYAHMDADKDVMLFEHRKPYNQIIVYRDRVRPGEADGRGIALDMLPMIKALNRIVAYDEKSMAFKANPPVFYDADGFFNPYSIRQWAGAFIARNPGGRSPLEAMEMPTSPDVLEKITTMQNQIKNAFMVDPLGEVESPVKSATEISIRENRAQRTSTTDISRLINELPKQIYHVASMILNERSLLVKKRVEVPGFDARKLKFEMATPLYDLQNQQDLNNFIQRNQILQQFYGEGAAIAASNLPEVLKFLTRKLNLPSNLSATDSDLQKFMQGYADQAQQAAQPQPSTSATQVPLPQTQQVQV